MPIRLICSTDGLLCLRSTHDLILARSMPSGAVHTRVIRYKIRAVEPGINPNAAPGMVSGKRCLGRHDAPQWCNHGEVVPMNDPLIALLSCVTDARRQQEKRYVLANILLFCIFGFLCGAKSYKALCSFIEERFALLQAAFPSKMTRAPAPSTLWRIIGLVDR